jgi:hypothetical protein
MNRLSKKEKGFVRDIVKGKTQTQAALNNYDTNSENVAGVIGSENIRKPKIQKAIKSIADQLPDEDLVKVHKEGLKASKEVWKNNNESGEIEKVSEEPDYATRHKYLDSAYKLKGSYAATKVEHSGEMSFRPSEEDKKIVANTISKIKHQ